MPAFVAPAPEARPAVEPALPDEEDFGKYGSLLAREAHGANPGAGRIRLALVAEVVHGAPHRFADPARFSLAHGGKDRHPFPVPIKVYDETIRVLKSAVRQAKLGNDEELGAIQRLDDQARKLERHARGPDVEALIAEERRASPQYGGRSVFGIEPMTRDSAEEG